MKDFVASRLRFQLADGWISADKGPCLESVNTISG